MGVIHLADNFEGEVMFEDVPVLVSFNSSENVSSQRMDPIIEELAGEYDDKIKVVSVDVDKHNNLSTEYGVMCVPTILLFHKGEVVKKRIGSTTKENLIEIIQEIL